MPGAVFWMDVSACLREANASICGTGEGPFVLLGRPWGVGGADAGLIARIEAPPDCGGKVPTDRTGEGSDGRTAVDGASTKDVLWAVGPAFATVGHVWPRLC